MIKLILFLLLLITCWPLAVVALVLYPLIWVILLPFRLLGLVVTGVFDLIAALFYIPVRVLKSM